MRGHTIRHCNSNEGRLLINHIKSVSIDYLVMGNRDTSLLTKTTSFYDYLMTYNMKELRFILSKRGDSINGTKTMLASRFIYRYFISELALEQFPGILSYDDRNNTFEYLNYWCNISEGTSIQEANTRLHEQFEFIASMDVFDFEYDNTSNDGKYSIHVTMEKNDSTNINHFECAICMQDDCCVSNKISIQCNHSFCKDCLTQYMIKCQESNKFPTCALCRGDFMDVKVNNIDVLEDFQNRFCV
jgi:hypothetical protein